MQTATAHPDESLHLVVVGDSVPFSAFCPGCVGFVDQYAATLESRTGLSVAIQNRSRDDAAGLSQIRDQLSTDDSLRGELSAADVVIVSVGFNNAYPGVVAGRPDCGGKSAKTLADQVAYVIDARRSCISEAVDSYEADYADVFTTIVDLAPKGAVLIALNVYNANMGNPETVSKVPAGELQGYTSILAYTYDAWNAMLCDAAEAHAFVCVDLYTAFNGPDGTRPLGDLSVDTAHPSQKGNDLIAHLLAGVDTSGFA